MADEEKDQQQDLAGEFLAEARRMRRTKREYRKVFLSTDEGKAVLTDLMQFCGLVRPAYVADDPVETARNEKAREIAIAILDQLDLRGFEAILELEKRGLEITQLGEET